jgi:hypothetical protein
VENSTFQGLHQGFGALPIKTSFFIAMVFLASPASAQPTTLPAFGYHNQLFVRAQINGGDEGYFAIDTGSWITSIDSETQQRLKLPQLGARKLSTFKGKLNVPVVLATDLQLGPVHLHDQPIAVGDISTSQLGEKHVMGLIGMDVLGRQPFALDFRRAILGFYDASNFAPPTGRQIRLLQDVAVPCARSAVEGHDAWFAIDTGYSGNMMLFHPFLESWPDLLQGRPVIYFDRNPGAEVGEYHARVTEVGAFASPYRINHHPCRQFGIKERTLLRHHFLGFA